MPPFVSDVTYGLPSAAGQNESCDWTFRGKRKLEIDLLQEEQLQAVRVCEREGHKVVDHGSDEHKDDLDNGISTASLTGMPPFVSDVTYGLPSAAGQNESPAGRTASGG
jgi:hypothetical protein